MTTNPAPTVWIEGPGTDPELTHIERINRDTPNPAHIPGLDFVHPLGKGIYPKEDAPKAPERKVPREAAPKRKVPREAAVDPNYDPYTSGIGPKVDDSKDTQGY